MYWAEEKPGKVEALTVLFAVEGGAWFFAALLLDFFFRGAGPPSLCCGVPALLGALDLVVAYGLWNLSGWSWTAGIVLAAVGLAFVPVGTVVGIIALILLLRPEVRLALGETPWEVYGAAYGARIRQAYPGLMRARAEAAAALRRLATEAPANPVPVCATCGAELEPGDMFCGKCGSTVG